MSPLRRLLRACSLLALAAALLLLWRHRQPPPASPAAVPAPAPAPPTLPERTAPQPVGVTVLLDVIDPSGAPLVGVDVSLNGAEGTTDAQGRLALRGVQQGIAVTAVSPPWLIHSRSTSGAVIGDTQRRLLILERACPGALHLLEEDGGPIEGVRVFRWRTAQISAAGSAVPLISDSDGAVFLPQRPCGAVSISARLPGGETLPDLDVFVEDSDPATLIIPRPRDGVLQVVDADGVPLPATAHAPLASSIEPDGTGRFAIQARRALLPLTVSADGYPEQRVRVPLTGGVFEHVIETPRAVSVTVRCDAGDCPEALYCAMARCEPEGGNRHRCRCPDEAAPVQLPGGAEIGTVFPEDDAIDIDLRDNVALRGQWIGEPPCEASVHYERGVSQVVSASCDEAGRFALVGLRPGWVTVRIQGRGAQAAHSLELLPGDDVDMGQLWPDSASAVGFLDADFPLTGARLSSFPQGEVVLEPGGTFTIGGLPGQTASVTLYLESPIYGQFRDAFGLVAGEEIVWRLSWRPAESALGDTADPGFDSGEWWDDTGWSERGDSGWDSGL